MVIHNVLTLYIYIVFRWIWSYAVFFLFMFSDFYVKAYKPKSRDDPKKVLNGVANGAADLAGKKDG